MMVLPYWKQRNSWAKDEARLENGLESPSGLSLDSEAGCNSRLTGVESLDSEWMSMERRSSTLSISTSHFRSAIQSQTRIRDESDVFSAVLICITVAVASACGLAAWVLHMAVKYAGCLGGVNGCHSYILVDALKPYGIGPSLFFIVSSGLSGLCCSLILHCPCGNGIARRCKGGGSADTKIVISSGQAVSGWVPVLRILLAALYCGGGNPLGTEGPIIHLSSAMATWLVSLTGRKRKKFLSTFGVIGATAGISAGFNVLVTGFVYVIEELTRTLSRKLALILAFAAGVAVLVKDLLEKFLDNWWHQGHAHLMPEHETWAKLTDADIHMCLLLCIPIGALTGVCGWIFCHCAWTGNKFLAEVVLSKKLWGCPVLPSRLHLAIIGVLCGCLGAVGYEVTGVNAVWGTTIDAIPTALHKHLSWQHALLLFSMKFIGFILATAGGGPGGLLVPSLVTGGLLGVTVGRVVDGDENLCAACSVIGMGAMFASVMHLPVTGVIIIFELTRADKLILHIVLASFISSNVVARLPHGSHSFVHRQLLHNPLWLKLEKRDFIETDEHEIEADVAMFKSTFAVWLWTDHERLSHYFVMWKTGAKGKLLRQPTKNFFEDMVSEAVGEPPASPKSPKENRSDKWSPRSHCSQRSAGSRANTQANGNDSPRSERKSWRSEHGLNLSPRSELDPEERAMRRAKHDQWVKVASVIPGLNFRIWKTLDADQIAALAHAAEITAVAHEIYKDSPSRDTSRDVLSLPSKREITPVNSELRFDITPVNSELSPKAIIRESTPTLSVDGSSIVHGPSIVQNGGGEGTDLSLSPRSPKVSFLDYTSEESPARQNGTCEGPKLTKPDDPVFCIPSAPWTESNTKPHLVVYVANDNAEAAFVPESFKFTPSIGLPQVHQL